MAVDEHGFGIPIPDEDTQPYELQAIVAAGFEILIARVAGLGDLAAAPPAPDHGPAIADMERRLTELAARPVPADQTAAVEQLRREIADLKLSNLGRTAP